MKSWTRWRSLIAMLCLAIFVLPFNARADIVGGLENGYSDSFDYPGASLTNNVPIDQSKWQIAPVGVDGRPVPNVWVVGGVQTSSLGQPGSEIKALKQQSTGVGATEPIALVRGGNWDNMMVSVRAAFVGTSQNSGVGVTFRVPVDPVSGIADKNNYYLFSAINTSAGRPEFCPIGRCFVLGKMLGGRFFVGAWRTTYVNFTNPNGAEPHTYKVVMVGNRIQCYFDGQLVIDFTDTTGDDVSGDGRLSMPGPMFANGTAGVRTSFTKAWFDDFVVLGDGPIAYEGRAAGVSVYGQVGTGSNGLVFGQNGADTNFQHHDHDFPVGGGDGSIVAPASPANGITGGALVSTVGRNGTVTSSAKLLGFTGTMTQALPDGTTVDITIVSDAVSSTATAACDAVTTKAELLNFAYIVVVKAPNRVPLINEFKNTQINPPPNYVVGYPADTGGYVGVTLNAQRVTEDPKRAEVSAVRIDIFNQPAVVRSGESTVAHTGDNFATIHLANVVAGRLCPGDVI